MSVGGDFIYVFYLDQFLIRNFLIHFLHNLWVVNTKRHPNLPGGIKIAGVALFCAVADGGLLLLRSEFLYKAISLVVLQPLCIWGLFRPNTVKQFLRVFSYSCVCLFLLMGAVLAAESVIGLTLEPVFLCGCLAFLLAPLWRDEERTKDKKLYQVSFPGINKTYSCVGFWDSGNELEEPIERKPVHIISADLAKRLDCTQPCGILTYCALGIERELPIYCISKMEVEGTCYTKVYVGIAQEELLKNKPYEVILNAYFKEGNHV